MGRSDDAMLIAIAQIQYVKHLPHVTLGTCMRDLLGVDLFVVPALSLVRPESDLVRWLRQCIGAECTAEESRKNRWPFFSQVSA